MIKATIGMHVKCVNKVYHILKYASCVAIYPLKTEVCNPLKKCFLAKVW